VRARPPWWTTTCAQLLGGQFGHHEIAEARQDMHGAAADGVLNGLPFVVLELDVALHGLAHGEALDLAAAVRRRDHGAGLGGRLLEREYLHAVRRGRVVGEAQCGHAIFAVADVAPQDPASCRFAFPALPTEMDPTINQGLPMRLPPALEPAAST
jgi:hypothetical protein